jgi:hypothetical protein
MVPPLREEVARMSAASRKGASFERLIADSLAVQLDDDRIDRRVKHGVNDRGDLTGLRVHGQRVVAELKNQKRMSLAEWVDEAEVERGNDDALVALCIHKRRGKGDPLDQYVSMTVRDLLALMTGERP